MTNGPDSVLHGGKLMGMVVDGSLTRGVEIRLDPSTSVEDIKVGAFVTVHGEKLRFFGVVTDVALGAADPGLKYTPPDVQDPFIAQVVAGTTAYGTISVLPTLTMPPVLGDSAAPMPAKTVPAHFSGAYAASERDVEMVFGREDERHFWIGNPLDMETKVCLDLKSLVERSVGVFGKSGTGKTFLTRLLLVGILQSKLASTLVFDMHSEYGWQGRREGGTVVKGLKQLYPSKVAVFSLDEESSRRRGLSPDEVVRIGYDEIQPEDVEVLQENLGLSDTATQAAYNVQRKLGTRQWLQRFLDMEGRDAVFDMASEISVQPQALGALHNRLSRLKRYGFLDSTAGEDSVERILRHLDRGMHVVLEFGRYGNDPQRLYPGHESPHPAHPRAVRETQRGGGGWSRGGAYVPGDNHRGVPQVPQPVGGLTDHLRHHRQGDAQIQRDPDGDRPASGGYRLGGDEPDWDQADLSPGQRQGRGRGVGGSAGQP